ncbi:MAG: ATP-binding protein [Acidimicrobiales bacterium]
MPLFLAGRQQEMRRFQAALRSAPDLPLNVRLTGLRGIGKTVLLKELENLAKKAGWITSRVQIEPRHNTEDDLSSLLVGLCAQAQREISRIARMKEAIRGVAYATRGLVRVSWDEIEFSLGAPGERERSVVRALFDVAALADRHGQSGYLLMLDEAQVLRDDKTRGGEYPLSLLIAAMNELQDRGLPVGLVVCGLPTLRANLLRARTYTERMFRGEEIGQLDSDEAVNAFVRPLDDTEMAADPDLVERVIAEVEGYPFFIQLWGSELWEAAQQAEVNLLSTKLLEQVEPDIYRRLDIDFYDSRVESLTPAEQDLLMTAASCPYPPLRTVDIHQVNARSEANVNVLMGRLTEQGVIYRIQKGQYEYTAPKFNAYLQRRVKKLTKWRQAGLEVAEGQGDAALTGLPISRRPSV